MGRKCTCAGLSLGLSFLLKWSGDTTRGEGGVEGVDAGCYSDSEMRLCRGPLASVRLKKGDMYCSGWLLILLSPLEGRAGAVLHIHSPYFPTGHGIWLFVAIMVVALLCLFGPLIVFSRPSWTDCPWVEKASTPSTSFSFGPNDHIPLQTHLSLANFRPPSSPTTTTKLKRIYGVLHSLPRLPHSTGYGVLRPWQCW